MLNVHWNNYSFEENKKYLILYIGNFSPPHKGHVQNIEPYFNIKNVEILMYLFGNEERHNVPIQVSFDILKIYLQNVSNISVKQYDPSYKDVYSYKKIDKLLFIRGNENFNSTIKNSFLQEYGNLIKKIRNKGILCDLLLLNRSVGISSTELCKNSDNIEHFLPIYLNEKDIKDVKNLLKKINLK